MSTCTPTARAALSTQDVSRLEEWCAACAPDQDLRAQYNQDTDPRRYEYMLKPIDDCVPVLGEAVQVDISLKAIGLIRLKAIESDWTHPIEIKLLSNLCFQRSTCTPTLR